MKKCFICERKIISAWKYCEMCKKVKSNYTQEEYLSLMGDYIRLTEMFAQQQLLIEMLNNRK